MSYKMSLITLFFFLQMPTIRVVQNSAVWNFRMVQHVPEQNFSIEVHGRQAYLLRKCCLITRRIKTIDSHFGGSVHACSLFHSSPYTRTCCSRLLMMGGQTRSHCQPKDTQHLTIKSSWPKWLVLGYSTCRYFVMRWNLQERMEDPNKLLEEMLRPRVFVSEHNRFSLWPELWAFRI